ncbi:hypothetical protein ERO13_A02G080500v2 [Gossypium hirsutum]|uniref:Uncharacterized protein n=3 Tax=Gossypium TaxID=3633 RepID=A0A5J5WKK6_GOSBA|nr:hypothetical protein ES319_A02G087600v1 [Gossypium barbadense]KAG4211016.1 hypothetical protein ERO13_A02G080500v2 [Gossypium hirsutum]TYH27793.1 hypothetical protein ES288_A02G096900v1 [Gossypium darwinii]TYI39454.1 hypothetical protein ES332_A02G099900v1 [Gossypium tomentosum]
MNPMTVFTLQKMQFLRKLMVIHNRGFSYDGARDGGSQRLKYIFYSFRALGLLSRRYRFSMKSSKCVGSMVGFIQLHCLGNSPY